MKKKISVIVFVAAIAAYNLFSISIANAQGPIINIPDANFKAYLVVNFDSNSDNNIDSTEAANVTGTINVSSSIIADLTGIEAFTALTSLNCAGNNLTSLNVSANRALITLHCEYNMIASLNISANEALTTLYCYYNLLTGLDVSSDTSLTLLDCHNNLLTSLNVSANTALETLYCNFNSLTSLNVSSNTALTVLNCRNNLLTSLDVSANTTLTYLNCFSNQLHGLDVSANMALVTMYCHYNQLTSLNVSGSTALIYLVCNNNQLTSLDVSANTALGYLICDDNNLTGLNGNNGNNINFSNFDARNNPNLTCIQVDDFAYSDTASGWFKDPTASYSAHCSVGIDVIYYDDGIAIYPNPNTGKFKIDNLPEYGTLEIFNGLGEKIYPGILRDENVELNAPTGIYFVKVSTGEKSYTQKLVIQ
jgi:hypothetical protein